MIDFIKHLLFGKNPVNFSELVKNGALIIDVRTPGEFAGGHIKNSVNIPLDKLHTQVQSLKNKNVPLITCCASGMRSASAAQLLRSKGIAEVYNGGGWRKLSKRTE